MVNPDLPLQIDFIFGSKILRGETADGGLPIVKNGPPGTSILFSDGSEIPLPSDQIVEASDLEGAAIIGFGGMKYTKVEGEYLYFQRWKDLRPEEELSPERGRLMTLPISQVQCVSSYGSVLWQSAISVH